MAIESQGEQDQQELLRRVADFFDKFDKIGTAPSALPPRFGATGVLDPTLEYFVRNELEKLETRFGAKLKETEAGLKEHLEKELRKGSESFSGKINKTLTTVITVTITTTIAIAGAAVTVAHYWK
jgi:hypothetical protein